MAGAVIFFSKNKYVMLCEPIKVTLHLKEPHTQVISMDKEIHGVLFHFIVYL
jgi:hypothetical protein